MTVFIIEGNRDRCKDESAFANLSNSFLNFEAMTLSVEGFQNRVKRSLKDENVLKYYDEMKATKQIDCLLMMKVNEEMIKQQNNGVDNIQMSMHDNNDFMFDEELLYNHLLKARQKARGH